MKRSFAITSLLLIFMVCVESFESIMDEDEMFQCFYKLVCSMDNVEEFYKIIRDAGTKNFLKYIDLIAQATDTEFSESTLDYVNQFKEIPCNWQERQMKKSFNEFCALTGEYILDICQQHDSELCIKADMAADQFASALAKYKAMGVCSKSDGEPSKLMPGGVGKMGSSSFG